MMVCVGVDVSGVVGSVGVVAVSEGVVVGVCDGVVVRVCDDVVVGVYLIDDVVVVGGVGGVGVYDVVVGGYAGGVGVMYGAGGCVSDCVTVDVGVTGPDVAVGDGVVRNGVVVDGVC